MSRKAVVAAFGGGLVVLITVAAFATARSSGANEHDELVRALCASQSPDKPDQLTEFIIDRDPSEHTNNLDSGGIAAHIDGLKDRARDECPERFVEHDAIVREAEQELEAAAEEARESEKLNDDEPEPNQDASGDGDVPESLSELGVSAAEWTTFQAIALEANYTFDPSDVETSEGLLLFAMDQCEQIAVDSIEALVADDVSAGASPADARSFWSTVEAMC